MRIIIVIANVVKKLQEFILNILFICNRNFLTTKIMIVSHISKDSLIGQLVNQAIKAWQWTLGMVKEPSLSLIQLNCRENGFKLWFTIWTIKEDKQ